MNLPFISTFPYLITSISYLIKSHAPSTLIFILSSHVLLILSSTWKPHVPSPHGFHLSIPFALAMLCIVLIAGIPQRFPLALPLTLYPFTFASRTPGLCHLLLLFFHLRPLHLLLHPSFSSITTLFPNLSLAFPAPLP